MKITLTDQEVEKTYFTADNHFNHANIIKFCDRPFDDVGKMDTAMVENWNKVVPHDGIVFHLGDFTLNDPGVADQYFGALNGRIRILGLPWHHDKRWLGYTGHDPYYTYDEHPVEILPPEVVLEIPGLSRDGRPHVIHLSHYPLGEWEASFHGRSWHLHGHSHGRYKGDANHTGDYCLDVGVDVWNFHPLSFGGLLEVFYGMGWM